MESLDLLIELLEKKTQGDVLIPKNYILQLIDEVKNRPTGIPEPPSIIHGVNSDLLFEGFTVTLKPFYKDRQGNLCRAIEQRAAGGQFLNYIIPNSNLKKEDR